MALSAASSALTRLDDVAHQVIVALPGYTIKRQPPRIRRRLLYKLCVPDITEMFDRSAYCGLRLLDDNLHSNKCAYYDSPPNYMAIEGIGMIQPGLNKWGGTQISRYGVIISELSAIQAIELF